MEQFELHIPIPIHISNYNIVKCSARSQGQTLACDNASLGDGVPRQRHERCSAGQGHLFDHPTADVLVLCLHLRSLSDQQVQ